MEERRPITVEGIAPGAGFRPHVHRWAAATSPPGVVGNEAASVPIDGEGRRAGEDVRRQGLPLRQAWVAARARAERARRTAECPTRPGSDCAEEPRLIEESRIG